MLVKNGQADVTTYFVLRDTTNHAPSLSVSLTDIDLYYVEDGAAISSKADASALAAADSAHADNSAFHVGRGLYRIDWPDAAFDGGIGKKVYLVVTTSGTDDAFLDVELSPAVDVAALSQDATAADNLEAAFDGNTYNVGGGAIVAASVTGAVGSVTGAVGSVTGNVGGNVTGSVGSVTGAVGSVTADVGITQAGADKVWGSAARTLTSFGTLAADVATAVWAAGTRTLTSFGTLAADVWAAATRTLTAGVTLAAGAVDAAAIADNAIDAGAIATGAITNAKFAAGAIDAAAIADAAIDAATFAADIKTGSYLNAQVKGQDNIDFGALQKASLNAATPSVTVSDKTGFSLSNTGIDAIFTRQLTESYAADGQAPTVAQALLMIQQALTEFGIVTTTLTIKKLDGTTAAATFTLDDATAPTSITRAS